MFDLHIRSHSRLLMLLALVAFAAATASTVPALAAAPDQMDGQEIFGGDTFVLDGGVLRPATDTTAPDEQLYNVVGTSLDLTWGRWEQATALSSQARHIGRRTDVRIQLTGLLPFGLYSV